jgi:hypothetical protein
VAVGSGVVQSCPSIASITVFQAGGPASGVRTKDKGFNECKITTFGSFKEHVVGGVHRCYSVQTGYQMGDQMGVQTD